MIALWVGGTLLIHMLTPAGTITFVTSATASAATLLNIGPGLHLVGPTQNFGFFSEPVKIVMCVLMALGRLEVYALLVLVLPRFWRGN
jgi:trk system potassium uptake protein TrkH